jgi:type I restriction enzyme M protein
MNRELKESIIGYIRQRDPKGELIVQILANDDYSSGKITYNKDNLILHRNISVLTDEEYVRAYLVVRLSKELKYPPSCIELEKQYEAGRPKTIKPRIDILVKDKRAHNENTFFFIEVKSPDKFEGDKVYIGGQLFKLAAIEDKESPVKYLVYYTSRADGGSIEDYSIIIDYVRYPSFQSWADGGKISLDRLPGEYGVARKLVYVNKKDEDLAPEEKKLDQRVTRERFNFLRKDLHDVLWGGGGMNYNDIFSNLVKLFLTKIFDEDTTTVGEAYTFQIEFKDGKPELPGEVYERINGLFKQAQKEYLGYSDEILHNSVGIDREKISDSKVAYVVEQLQSISLTKNENKDNGDLLGEFFEGIVSEGFKQDKGQFFTHPNIVRFVLHAIGLDQLAVDLVNGKENAVKPRLPFICDPACGSGTFLIEAMKLITSVITGSGNVSTAKKTNEFVAANFPDLTPNVWAKEFIYGCEIYGDLGLATKVNMVLHGDGNINIFAGDPQGNGLKPFKEYELPGKISALARSQLKSSYSYDRSVNESFDIIVSNPPFSIKKKALPPEDVLEKSFVFFDKPNSENLFIERWYQLLREGGRIGVVLPESVFDTTENVYIRLFLYKYFKIKAIVSLPQLTFQPFTSTKTSLLFARKKTRQEVEAYEEKWRDYSNEYQRLKRQVVRYLSEEFNDEAEAKTILRRYLKNYLEEVDQILSAKEIIMKYQDEIREVNGNQNWWVFGEVSKHFDYEIFMAEAEEIGYKRTKRGEQKRPNMLFQESESGSIITDIDNPKAVLDFLKLKVKWD